MDSKIQHYRDSLAGRVRVDVPTKTAYRDLDIILCRADMMIGIASETKIATGGLFPDSPLPGILSEIQQLIKSACLDLHAQYRATQPSGSDELTN
jgi:hypothetical protein